MPPTRQPSGRSFATSIFVILALLALDGCTTARQACAAKAMAKTRALDAQIEQTEQIVQRGYALHRQNVPYTHTMICYEEDRNARTCQSTQAHLLETPVSVDIEAMAARLEALKAKRHETQKHALFALQACQSRYNK